MTYVRPYRIIAEQMRRTPESIADDATFADLEADADATHEHHTQRRSYHKVPRTSACTPQWRLDEHMQHICGDERGCYNSPLFDRAEWRRIQVYNNTKALIEHDNRPMHEV